MYICVYIYIYIVVFLFVYYIIFVYSSIITYFLDHIYCLVVGYEHVVEHEHLVVGDAHVRCRHRRAVALRHADGCTPTAAAKMRVSVSMFVFDNIRFNNMFVFDNVFVSDNKTVYVIKKN